MAGLTMPDFAAILTCSFAVGCRCKKFVLVTGLMIVCHGKLRNFGLSLLTAQSSFYVGQPHKETFCLFPDYGNVL
jgi:hypothetical protein